MKHFALVFLHQLFEDRLAINAADEIYLLEEPLFFYDEKYKIKMHKAKIALHRASMQYFADELRGNGKEVKYLK